MNKYEYAIKRNRSLKKILIENPEFLEYLKEDLSDTKDMIISEELDPSEKDLHIAIGSARYIKNMIQEIMESPTQLDIVEQQFKNSQENTDTGSPVL